MRLQDLEKLPHDASIGAPFIDVKSYEVSTPAPPGGVGLDPDCDMSGSFIVSLSVGEMTRLPVQLHQAACGTVRALVTTESNLVGWISLCRRSRGLHSLVKPGPQSRSRKSTQAPSVSG